MSQADEDGGRLFDRYDDNEDEGVTCRRCGATGLEWINTGVRYRLMGDDGKFHECATKPDTSDFKDETGNA
jgi:hypothetical protein